MLYCGECGRGAITRQLRRSDHLDDLNRHDRCHLGLDSLEALVVEGVVVERDEKQGLRTT